MDTFVSVLNSQRDISSFVNSKRSADMHAASKELPLKHPWPRRNTLFLNTGNCKLTERILGKVAENELESQPVNCGFVLTRAHIFIVCSDSRQFPISTLEILYFYSISIFITLSVILIFVFVLIESQCYR